MKQKKMFYIELVFIVLILLSRVVCGMVLYLVFARRRTCIRCVCVCVCVCVCFSFFLTSVKFSVHTHTIYVYVSNVDNNEQIENNASPKN